MSELHFEPWELVLMAPGAVLFAYLVIGAAIEVLRAGRGPLGWRALKAIGTATLMLLAFAYFAWAG